MFDVHDFCKKEEFDYDPDGEPSLIWVDTETTGFHPFNHSILEIGMVATTQALSVIDIFHVPVRPMNDPRPLMDDAVLEMHTNSGLLEQSEQHGISYLEATEEACAWLDAIHGYGEDSVDPLPMAGSSVHFDRRFLQVKLPEIDQQFHYRNVDVSTIKELCQRYNPDVYSHLEEYTTKKGLHRALPDIADSIKEFRFYLDNFLFATEW